MPPKKQPKTGAQMEKERRTACQFEDERGVRLCRRGGAVTYRGRPYCPEHAEAQQQREAKAIEKRVPPSLRFPHMPVERSERLAELHEDPFLLDPRPAIATERLMLDDVLGAPEDYVMSVAHRIACIRWREEAPPSARVGGDPDGDLLRLVPDPEHDIKPHHITEARRRLAKEGADSMHRFAENVLAAAKVAKMEGVFLTLIEPFWQEFGLGVRRALDDLIEDEPLRDRLLASIAALVTTLMAKMKATAEQAKG